MTRKFFACRPRRHATRCAAALWASSPAEINQRANLAMFCAALLGSSGLCGPEGPKNLQAGIGSGAGDEATMALARPAGHDSDGRIMTRTGGGPGPCTAEGLGARA